MKLTKKLASCLLLLAAAALVAAPLSFTPVRITQPDGSEVDIFASGDEFHNWLHDSQNYTIVQNDEGWYVYARQDGEGVAPTGLNPRQTWADKQASDTTARALVDMFNKNFAKYESHVDSDVKAAAPAIQQAAE